jgi:orotate phosphoribosyltransferase-like protein
MKSKVNKWTCVVILMNEEKLNKSFTCLQDIADELNISRHIINDIVNNRKKNNKYDDCIYYPKIKITEIEKENRKS